MKRNGKRTAIALTIAMMLPGTSGTALAASPEIHPSHIASATKSEEKLPERATQIVAALEKLEPALKALTKRTIVKSEMDEKLLNLYLESPESNEMGATVVFDSKTGELFTYNASLYIWKQGEIATDEVILQRAEKAVLELLGADKRKQAGSPQLSKAVEEVDPEELTDPLAIYRTIYYPVVLNGLEILGNRTGIYVTTDYAGHILGVSTELLDLKETKVPDPKTALTPEAVKKQYFTPERLDFGYVLEGKDAKPGMQYVWMNSLYIDAVTGKQIDFIQGTEIAGDGKRNPANLKKLTLSSKGEPLIVKSRADGEKVVASLFDVDTKVMFTEYNTGEVDGEFIHSWSDEFGHEEVSISVDASTGEVTGANISMETKSLPVPLSKEEALKKAISVIEPYVAKSSTEWQVEIFDPYKQPKLADWMIELNEGEGEEEEDTGTYTFLFHELHDGLPVFNRYYWMVVDIESGQVLTIIVNLPEKEGTLPILKPSVTEQQAAEIVAKNLPVKLSYFWPTYKGKQAPFLTLVYTVDKSKGWPYLDAVNGTLEWDEYEE
ncbi:PepSY domain-containing protein [Brevibacillus sp. IT-7CA2]|uniref:YcdB/YcdC domain-containing protein n=1 Tax=Brevibacillus sp. IT-7CA2 TaxID=3026436 RepID=UPI0039E02097